MKVALITVSLVSLARPFATQCRSLPLADDGFNYLQDRPERQIYNPAQRAAERKRQQQTRQETTSSKQSSSSKQSTPEDDDH